MQTWDEMRLSLMTEPGHVVVLGAAGTGKTELLIELMVADQGADAPPLALCLTRQAASQVRDRVVRTLGRATFQPAAMTLHAWCLGLLARFSDPELGPPRLLTAPEQEFRIRELLAGGDPALWPDDLAPARLTAGLARQLRAVLARARQLGLDPVDVQAAGRAAREASWVALGGFFEEYLQVTDLEEVLDYAELVHRCRILLADADVRAALHGAYARVLVDEFSELDPAQLGLVQSLVGACGAPLVAFADPDTSIYEFRGAEPRSVAEFERRFHGATRVLGERPGCPAALASAAARVARRLASPIGDGALLEHYRGAAGTPGGLLEVRTLPDEAALDRFVAGELRAEHLEAGRPWHEMAVLVRAGRQRIPALVRALTDAGVPVEVAGDEIGLADELAVRPLLLALSVAGRDEPCDADEAQRLLTSGWGGLDAMDLRTVGRALRRSRPGVPSPSGDLLAEALRGGEYALDVDAHPVAARAWADVRRRAELLAEARGAIAEGRTPLEVLWLLWSGTPWPEELRARALAGGEAAARADRDLNAVLALFQLAEASHAAAGRKGVRSLLAEVAAQQIPADVERESAVQGRGVRVLTAHRAKGRRWPFVVVAGVQEGVWPDVGRAGSIFDPQRLRADGLGEGVSTRALVAAERRLFLLAVTRASERLLVAAVAGTEGEADQPSRFLNELGVPVLAVSEPPPRLHTLRALVAELRRVAQDAAVSPELRQAATRRLARLAASRDDAGRPLVPEAHPDRWWGLTAPSGGPSRASTAAEVRLTPSQLESLLSCPRQYFLSREAKADPPRSASALLGTVIHGLAERAQADGLELPDAMEYLAKIWDALPFTAAWFAASERAAAEQAVVRLLGWQAAREGIPVVGVEVPFEMRVSLPDGDVVVVGTVDRIEADAHGRLSIIDFKSGRALPTQAAAAASPQLGLYQLAVEQGAFDHLAPGASEAGSAGAHLVYLRHGEDDFPKTFAQPSLRQRPHLGQDPQELAYPTWVHAQLAAARRVLASGRFPATPSESCQWCAFAGSCPAKSGQVVA